MKRNWQWNAAHAMATEARAQHAASVEATKQTTLGMLAGDAARWFAKHKDEMLVRMERGEVVYRNGGFYRVKAVTP
jgi:hypothetical protein